MAERITVKVKTAEGVTLPAYATEGSAGMDIRACERVVIRAGARGCVGTGLYLEIPWGYEAQVRPRSGLALKHGVTVLNAPGTIDSDYRGEVRVILANFGENDFTIESGERIAQIIFAAVTQARLETSVELGGTERGAGGFGSTGRK